MNERMDGGPMLLQDSVPVAPRAVTGQVIRSKTLLASRRIGEAIDRLVEGHPGRPQDGEPSTFTRADGSAIRSVRDPAKVTFDDLRRRLRAFELVRIHIGDDALDVTSIRRVEGRPGRPSLAFTTADGVRVEPTRFVHLPWSLFQGYRIVR
jgi:methionyl-tRNA formyltransferase